MSAIDALRRQRIRLADLSAKNPVRVATTVALAAYTRSGNVILADANGALANIDNVALAVGDAFLLINGAAGADNGIYVVDSLGAVGAKWQATRRYDCSASEHLFDGMTVSVAEGLVYGGMQFILTTDAPITINTTSLSFSLAYPYSPLLKPGWVDEFIGGGDASFDLGDHGWGKGGTGTPSTAAMTPESGHLGGRRLGCSNTNGNSLILYSGSSVTTGGFVASDLEYFSYLFRLQSITAESFRIGCGNNTLSAATVGIMLKFDPAVNAKWQTVSVIGAGTETTTQSGFADVAIDTWYLFECWRNPTSGALSFALNRTMLTGHSVRLPTTEGMLPHVHLVTNEAVAKTFDIDRVEFRFAQMTKRWS